MIQLNGRSVSHCDGLSRRDFVSVGSLTAFGFGLANLLETRATRAEAPTASAQSIILLFAGGGPSQMETFDPKTGVPAEFGGDVKPLKTAIPGLVVSEHLPRIARMVQKTAILRAVSHSNSEHERGAHYLMTGHLPPRVNPLKNENPSACQVVRTAWPARKSTVTSPAFAFARRYPR